MGINRRSLNLIRNKELYQIEGPPILIKLQAYGILRSVSGLGFIAGFPGNFTPRMAAL